MPSKKEGEYRPGGRNEPAYGVALPGVYNQIALPPNYGDYFGQPYAGGTLNPNDAATLNHYQMRLYDAEARASEEQRRADAAVKRLAEIEKADKAGVRQMAQLLDQTLCFLATFPGRDLPTKEQQQVLALVRKIGPVVAEALGRKWDGSERRPPAQTAAQKIARMIDVGK